MKRGVLAFLAGLVFSAGLTLSGMTRPSKVLAFLDVTGAWDPSLAFVMVGAIGVAAIAFRLSGPPRTPILGDRFRLPASLASIDPKLVTGAAIFGVGWGLSGLCPGPAVVAVASGQTGALVFVGAMIAGMAVEGAVMRLASAGGSGEPQEDFNG
ncbi:MAG: DUF6691 family protein [Polyangiaceae bacterium]